MAVTTADKVVVELEAKNAEYDRRMKQSAQVTDRQFAQIRRGAHRTESRLQRMNRNISASMSSTAGSIQRMFGVLGVSVGGTALIQSIRGTISELSKLADTADRIGFNTEELQQLRFGFEQTGVAANTTDMALQRFSRRVAEAASGTGVLKDVLEANNVQLRNADGSMRSQMDLLRDYARLIKNAGSEQERLLLAFRAFDSEGAALVNGLVEDFDQLIGKVDEAGGVVEDELVQRARELDQEFAKTWRNFETNAKRAILNITPALQKLDDMAKNLLSQLPVAQLGQAIFGEDQTTPNARVGAAFSGEVQKADEELVNALKERYGAALDNATPTVVPSSADGEGGGGRGGSRNAAAAAALREAEAVKNLIQDLELEQSLVGATDLEREKANALRIAGAAATDEQRAKIEHLIEAIHREEEAIDQTSRAAEFMGDTLEDAFLAAIPTIETGNRALDGLLNTLIEVVAQAALLGRGPLAGMFGGGSGLLGGLFGDGIPGFANGTRSAPGGLAWVGEKGPELVNLPRGSQVVPNNAIPKSGGGGYLDVNVTTTVENGNLVPDMVTVAGQVAGQQIKQVNKSFRGRLQAAQKRNV